MKIKSVAKGFTLIELLVVVLIIGVLSAVAIPGYMRSVEKTRATEAIMALSNIAKAENDYFYAQSRYTSDFSKLVLTMVDKNTLRDASNSSYETEFFTYNLDNNQDLATASRQKGADSYTLYRFYNDPRTYCQPAGNKYCDMLGLEAGSFTHSIGAWQSCPGGVYPCEKACSRNTAVGYNCNGKYNEDGSFTETVCDANNHCVITTYNEDQKGIQKNYCYYYNAEDKKCFGNGGVEKYDEEGRLTYSRYCTEWNENNECTNGFYDTFFTYGDNGSYSVKGCNVMGEGGVCEEWGGENTYTYDANGNMTGYRYCYTVDSNGDCDFSNPDAQIYGGVYKYDGNGHVTLQAGCSGYDEQGECQGYSWVDVDKYDDYGNLLTSFNCSSTYNPETNDCEGSYGGRINLYDSNNHMIKAITCDVVASDRKSCETYSEWGENYEYTYNPTGNITTQKSCISWATDGTCETYSTSEWDNLEYTYDNAGNMTTKKTCTSWRANGTCETWGNSPWSNEIYGYDSNNNRISSRYCSAWSSDGTSCDSYTSGGTAYKYDEQGRQISSASCSEWGANGNCNSYGGGNIITYDDNGEQIYSWCRQFNSDGITCAQSSSGSQDIYDEEGNHIGSSNGCVGWNSNGECILESINCYFGRDNGGYIC